MRETGDQHDGAERPVSLSVLKARKTLEQCVSHSNYAVETLSTILTGIAVRGPVVKEKALLFNSGESHCFLPGCAARLLMYNDGEQHQATWC